jgi:hypothetical protein
MLRTMIVAIHLLGWLAVAGALAIAWYVWAHTDLIDRFRKDFQDAIDKGRGPPESPA